MSATKEKNGTWFSRFYYTDHQGNRKQKGKRGFSTKREALEFEREFLRKAAFETSMTFKSLCDLYIEDLSHRLKKYTMLNKRHVLERKILPFFEKMSVDSITPVIVRQFQNELLKEVSGKTGKPHSQTYIKNINVQLVAILNYAVRYHNLKENPCNKAGSVGKRDAKEMSIWTIEEFNIFIEALKDNREMYTGFNILFWTGVRIGELLALTVGDIDIKNKTLNINKSYQRLKGEDIITPPKTPKSNRIIKLTDNTIEMLKSYLGHLYEATEETRLFKKTRFNFNRELERTSKKAGVKKIRVHDLRHSHASMLINAGANPLAVSQRLGHEKIETTLNTYSHLYKKTTDELLDILNKI